METHYFTFDIEAGRPAFWRQQMQHPIHLTCAVHMVHCWVYDHVSPTSHRQHSNMLFVWFNGVNKNYVNGEPERILGCYYPGASGSNTIQGAHETVLDEAEFELKEAKPNSHILKTYVPSVKLTCVVQVDTQ